MLSLPSEGALPAPPHKGSLMDHVKTQYEAYPYPHRDPRDEDKRLIAGSPSALAEINYYLFEGARDWSQPFRALVAGGGTGDGLIMLAQQLTDISCPADIHYIDLSEASRAIAEARAERRKLTNITFHTGSLLTAPELGPFDYIDSVGVLHHLPDPDEGFAALAAALKPEGGMGLMVYGTLGRTGVYDVQTMLRPLTAKDSTPQAEVQTAQTLLRALPETNRFRRNPFLNDHRANPAGLYDLLLHKQDRSYTVPELYETLDKAGLDIVQFVGSSNYDCMDLINDAKLKARLSALPLREQQAFAELLTGNISKHTFYAAHADRAKAITLPRPGKDMIPVLQYLDVPPMVKLLRTGKPFAGRREGMKVSYTLPPLAADILELSDGKRTFADIQELIKPRPDAEKFYTQARETFRILNGLNMMMLRKA